MTYDSILYTTQHLIVDCGNVTEYFARNSHRFYLFSTCPIFMDEPTTLIEYREGRKVRSWDYRWYRGKNVILHYIFLYLYFVHARVFRVASGTDVITFHPLYCVGNFFFRLCKGGRTVFWVFDFFNQWDGLYLWYNILVDFYVRRLPVVLFLGQPMRDVYEKRVGRRRSARWDVLNLGIKIAEHERRPDDGLLGVIGNLKAKQGIERVMDAMMRNQRLRLEIVGIGVAMDMLRKHAERTGVADRVRFLGRIMDQDVLSDTTSRWQMGMALYERTPFTPYADPGKIKLYLQLGLPVITTDVTPMSKEIAVAGAVVEPTAEGVLRGIQRIRSKYSSFSDGVKTLAEKYEFRRLYDGAFSFLATRVVPDTAKA